MWRDFSRIGAVAAGLAVAACGSTPQHSNVLIFGTNTTLAIDASYSATSAPQVTIGYKRQEAVWMPLLVNTKPGEPCAVAGSPPDAPPHCLYIGRDGTQTDAYSVLASFDAKFSGKASTSAAGSGATPSAEAGGGLAQFFATGLAARTLAERGGAAVVSTGEAAKANANMLAAIQNAERGLPSATKRAVIRDIQEKLGALMRDPATNKTKLEACNAAAVEAGYSDTYVYDDGTKETYGAIQNFLYSDEISDSNIEIIVGKCNLG